MRTMAIDYGDQRIGLAVSDLLGMLAGEAWTMQEWDMERAARRIAEEAKARDVGTLVLGLPKNMDGSEGPRAEKSRAFRELLIKESGLPVILWDERRSSIEAHAILHSAGKKEKQHRKNVDAVAASLILEGYRKCLQSLVLRKNRRNCQTVPPLFLSPAHIMIRVKLKYGRHPL